MEIFNYFFRISGTFEFTSPAYFINDPKLAKLLAVKNFDHFCNRRTFDFNKKVDVIVSNCLLNMKGETWKSEYSHFRRLSHIKLINLIQFQACDQHCQHFSLGPKCDRCIRMRLLWADKCQTQLKNRSKVVKLMLWNSLNLLKSLQLT